DDHDALSVLVPTQSERGDRPHGLHGLDELEPPRRRLGGRRQLVEHLRQIGRQRAHLLLLALQRDELAFLTTLDVEDALALRTDGAGREVSRRVEVERRRGRSHRGFGRGVTEARSPSIAFIVSTLKPSARYAIAVIEAGAMTIR